MKDIESREDIMMLLTRFYSVAMEDELIGHHFEDLDLKSHVPVFTDFWDKILFGNPVYLGNPLAVHRLVSEKNALTLDHFRRWVAIFEATVDRNFEGKIAENAKLRAKMIAHSLNERLSAGDSGLVNIGAG